MDRQSWSEADLVLDVGTADGLVLRQLVDRYRFRGIGLDVRLEHLEAARGNVDRLVQADGRSLPFGSNGMRAVICTALFKHVEELDRLVQECHRVLEPGGKVFVIDPTPLGARLGLALGHLSGESIFHILGPRELTQLLVRHGFAVTGRERFMLAPVSLPGSRVLEEGLKRIGGDRLFLSQIVCGEKLS
jgi:SAM-dependent methyltransferase